MFWFQTRLARMLIGLEKKKKKKVIQSGATPDRSAAWIIAVGPGDHAAAPP